MRKSYSWPQWAIPAARIPRRRGIFRTTDGGKELGKGPLQRTTNTGGIDVAFDPRKFQYSLRSLWEAHGQPWSLVSGGAPEAGLTVPTTGGSNPGSGSKNHGRKGPYGRIGGCGGR